MYQVIEEVNKTLIALCCCLSLYVFEILANMVLNVGQCSTPPFQCNKYFIHFLYYLIHLKEFGVITSEKASGGVLFVMIGFVV